MLSVASGSVQHRVDNRIFDTLPHSMLEASEVVVTAARTEESSIQAVPPGTATYGPRGGRRLGRAIGACVQQLFHCNKYRTW